MPGMKESRRKLGHQVSEPCSWRLRALKTALAIFAIAAAIQSVRSLYQRAENGFGYDFYQFWLGGDVLRAHVAEGKPGTLDVYSEASHIKIGARYQAIAQNKSRRQRDAASDRKTVDTASSPFFYWVFSVLTPGDYDRVYRSYAAFSVGCMVATMTFFGWRLRYSVAGIGGAVALAAVSGPVYSDFHELNFNFPELAVCCVYLLLRDGGRNANRLSPTLFAMAGVVMGLLAAFKPNLILFPALLGISALASRRWREAFLEAGGFVAGAVIAVAVASWAFGGLSCWSAWGHVVLGLGARPTMPSEYGNFSITRNIYEVTGKDFISLFSAIGILLAIGAIWIGRRSRLFAAGRESRCDFDIEFRHDLAIFGIAVAVTLLSSGLAWVHYPILLFPFLLMAASRSRPAGIGITAEIVRCALLWGAILLLMYSPSDEIQCLLPFRVEANTRIWNHCSQAAVIITLLLGLWYEARLLRPIQNSQIRKQPR
jgi:hypothetical protein